MAKKRLNLIFKPGDTVVASIDITRRGDGQVLVKAWTPGKVKDVQVDDPELPYFVTFGQRDEWVSEGSIQAFHSVRKNQPA